MLLVPSQGVHLEMEEIHRVLPSDSLRVFGFTVRMPLSLLSDCLDDRLVELTNVVVLGLGVQLELELPLRHCALDSLAVAGIAGGSVAGSAVLQQATILSAAVATVRSSFFHSFTLLFTITNDCALLLLVN